MLTESERDGELRRAYSRWPSPDLLAAVRFDRSSYEARAIELMEIEIRTRGDLDEAERILSERIRSEIADQAQQIGRLHVPTGMQGPEVRSAIEQGGRFVVFGYCISLLLVTFRRPSSPHFIAPDHGAFRAGLLYSLISVLLGWWGVPFGLIYTPITIFKNCGGGTDVTREILQLWDQDEEYCDGANFRRLLGVPE